MTEQQSTHIAASLGPAAAVTALLQLHPAEVGDVEQVVLTATPDVWNRLSIPAFVIDLSRILGVPAVSEASHLSHNGGACPASTAELANLMSSFARAHLCLDGSILLHVLQNRGGEERGNRIKWIRELHDQVPKGKRYKKWFELDGVSGLLAWGINMPAAVSVTAVVNAGMATHPKHGAIRSYVQERLRLCAAVSLPGGMFPQMRWVPATLLFFGGEREHAHVDLVSSDLEWDQFQNQAWHDRLRSWLENGETSSPYAVPVGADMPWSQTINLDVEAITGRLGRLGSLVHLSDVSEVIPGQSGLKGNPLTQDGIPVIGRSLLSNGFLDLESAPRTDAEVTSLKQAALLSPGDLLLSTKMTERFGAILYTDPGLTVANDGVIIVRPRDARVTADFLLEYLNSTVARDLLQASGSVDSFSGVASISARRVGRLPMPLIDPALVRGLSDLDRTEEALRRKADELRSKRQGLFNAEVGRAFRTELAEVRRKGNLFASGIERADSLPYRISNFYPFPLAHSHRAVEGYSDSANRYLALFRAVESMLAFVGSVALALLRPEDREASGILIRDHWRVGMSEGKWQTLTGDACGVLSQYHDSPLAGEMSELDIRGGTGFGEDVSKLITARNAFHHNRIRPEEYGDALATAQDRFLRCMERLTFFTDFPLRLVTGRQRDRHRGSKIEYLSCIGDHPGWESGETWLPASSPLAENLFEDEVYIVSDDNEWISLYPFITVAKCCPKCLNREMFLVDRWDGKPRGANLKSFDRGHEMPDDRVAAELAKWP